MPPNVQFNVLPYLNTSIKLHSNDVMITPCLSAVLSYGMVPDEHYT